MHNRTNIFASLAIGLVTCSSLFAAGDGGCPHGGHPDGVQCPEVPPEPCSDHEEVTNTAEDATFDSDPQFLSASASATPATVCPSEPFTVSVSPPEDEDKRQNWTMTTTLKCDPSTGLTYWDPDPSAVDPPTSPWSKTGDRNGEHESIHH